MDHASDGEILDSLRKLPLKTQVKGLHETTVALHQTAEQHIVPAIRKLVLSPSDYETCLKGAYLRMVLWMKSLAQLPEPHHLQAASVGARALFELLLDMKLLIADPSRVAKYRAYTDVARFMMARGLIKYSRSHTDIPQNEVKTELAFVSDEARRKRIESWVEQYWGRDKRGKLRWPMLGWMNLNSRLMAHRVDPEYERIYVADIPRLNIYTHGGAAGIDNLSEDALICVFALAQALAQRLFADATFAIADEFHLFKGLPALRDQIEGSQRAAAEFFVELAKSQGLSDTSNSTASPGSNKNSKGAREGE